jgi:hypothetical protein
MAIREGRWDCPSCGRKGNRGPEKHCAGCGAPRGEEVSFYLPEDAPEVTDPEALARARSGPDWHCPYCGGDNRADYPHCTGCGAPKDGAKERQVVEHRFEAPPPPPAQPADAGDGGPRKRKKKRWGCFKTGCGASAVGGLVLFLLSLIFGGPHETVVSVEGFSWERTLTTQNLVTETEGAWEGSVPGGARVLGRETRVHSTRKIPIGSETRTRTVTKKVQVGTEQVKVGVRDLGNGYFEDIYEDRPIYENRSRQETYQEPLYREEPIHKTWVRFEVDRWKKGRTVVATGTDRSPRWPEEPRGPRQRVGARTEAYFVHFRDADGNILRHRAASETEWRGFEPGQRLRARVRGRRIETFLGAPQLEKPP